MGLIMQAIALQISNILIKKYCSGHSVITKSVRMFCRLNLIILATSSHKALTMVSNLCMYRTPHAIPVTVRQLTQKADFTLLQTKQLSILPDVWFRSVNWPDFQHGTKCTKPSGQAESYVNSSHLTTS